ncbi:MAG: PD-(D/E)XK nuclease family protein [Flavobacteriia bacterium]|nr:PD-(D/E)XK nuclease family protein [Flavobacteriia bacterium]
MKEGLPAMSLGSFKKLFQQHWSQKSIAYHGNPLEGLQIMGLLETRLLDFETIICLGMNEGKMPPTNPIQSMIPMDLRNYFGLPTPREKQGLFAHHFYRLLHTCQKMYVTYTSAQEMIGSNEASRYLLQLELELSRINPNIKLTKSFYTIPQEKSSKVKIAITKSPEIILRLDALFQKSTSASLLKRFAQCPLDFYYKDVLEFGEEDKVEEEVENNTFGTFIHNALELMYEPFSRHDKEGNLKSIAPKSITSFDIDKMLEYYQEKIRDQFMLHFNNDKESFTKGKNLLSFKMANELTHRFLLKEKEFLMQQTEPVFIESLEQTFIHELEVEIVGEKKKITVKGIIDRIDSIGGKIRIIDYKSGKVGEDDTKIGPRAKSNEEFIKALLTKKHVLQLVMYAFLYKQKFNELPDSVDIISFINIQNGTFQLNTGGKTLAELVEIFPDLLTEILESIYNPEENFEHKEKQFSFCSYC